ncbi:hypothetical protein LTR10_024046 [Elasticomyces elasticus]|uniref:Uncharacterized protein n=1 Tax=Exophiala sideris TaxID=1016849 RepID=A0ABR0J6L1_9EURO|nr:hypothetical protein LTR10_024046 [Elasticomyces elasticus]KAK5028942.1 hypothetical protein LTS07_006323 [Exophiala sideris]KAK5035811.1 hypothetical protein LTR13_005942 [Exophiala sideris]KAK5057446.1 hypothetical protein LTR69_007487 [Exophiala sideris]KAK5181579.1 hypothetical protein LTR44_005778 [Eurotiomycetes sp. CCFEE 6388]
MAFKEIFHFDEEAYKQKVHCFPKDKCYQELAQREVCKRRRIYSTGVKIVCCSLLLLPTCGGTGFGLFLGFRQRSIAKKKYHHVVEAMRAHGFALPEPKKRDKLVPLAINVFIYSLSFGLMFGLEEAGLIATNEMAAYGVQSTGNIVDPSFLGEAQQFVVNPADFVHGVVHGADTQVSELHGLATPNETMIQHVMDQHLEQPISETSYQYMSGETAGYQLAPHIEQLATVTLASQGLEAIAKPSITHQFNRKPVATKRMTIVTETAIPMDGDKMVY